ncbi:hypothetical protein TWF696_006506 [Orbilia brochopaga]|uniref:Aminoglycoside phosphotransferase domain-containing protein n=1 Tax=Orbilia brochopaga TaxID=3140254 RepID=A0AAV9UZT6_9PEZI
MEPPLSRFQLPYFRDPKELPAPLPSVAEIRASTDLIKGHDGWKKVVRIREHFIVKYAASLSPTEGENLLFVEKHLVRISTPKLYAMWKDSNDGTFYIIMEYLPGETLDSLWPKLTEPEKDSILSKLRHALQQMRALPPPFATIFGSVSGGHIMHHLFAMTDYPPNISGPFDNEHDFIMGLINKVRVDAKDNKSKRLEYLAGFYEKQLLPEFTKNEANHASTFTHSDLQRKNILVRFGHDLQYIEISILDWEVAGWYPRYWEYVSAFFGFQWDDWPEELATILDPWPSETAMMKMLYQTLWF